MNEPEDLRLVAKFAHASIKFGKALSVPAVVRAWVTGAGRKQVAIADGEVAKIEDATEKATARTAGEIMRMDASTVRDVAEILEVTTPDAKLALFAALQTHNPRHLTNIGAIVNKSDKMLEDMVEVPDEGPSDDWWDRLYQAGRSVSSDDLQDFFAAMVAGEVKSPGSVSFQTIEVSRKLDSEIARLFAKWVALSFSSFGRLCLCTLGRTAGQNELSEFGFSYSELRQLTDIGLIGTDYNSWIDVSPHVFNETFEIEGVRVRLVLEELKYAGHDWALEHNKVSDVAEEQENPPPDTDEVRLDVIFATKAGAELASVIPIQENTAYTEQLNAYLAGKEFKLSKVSDTSMPAEVTDALLRMAREQGRARNE